MSDFRFYPHVKFLAVALERPSFLEYPSIPGQSNQTPLILELLTMSLTANHVDPEMIHLRRRSMRKRMTSTKTVIAQSLSLCLS